MKGLMWILSEGRLLVMYYERLCHRYKIYTLKWLSGTSTNWKLFCLLRCKQLQCSLSREANGHFIFFDCVYLSCLLINNSGSHLINKLNPGRSALVATHPFIIWQQEPLSNITYPDKKGKAIKNKTDLFVLVKRWLLVFIHRRCGLAWGGLKCGPLWRLKLPPTDIGRQLVKGLALQCVNLVDRLCIKYHSEPA